MNYSKIKITHFKVISIALNMFAYTEKFKEIRSKSKYKMNSCHVCNKKFSMNEKIALAITDKGNKVMCNKCARELVEENPQIKVIDKESEK